MLFSAAIVAYGKRPVKRHGIDALPPESINPSHCKWSTVYIDNPAQNNTMGGRNVVFSEGERMKLSRRDYLFDNICARYLLDEDTGAVSLVLLPAGKTADAYDERRTWLKVPELVRIGMDFEAWHVGSLVHLAIRGDAQSKGAGATLKYGASTAKLRFSSQERTDDTVTTVLRSDDGARVTHRLTWLGRSFRVETTFHNDAEKPVTLELLTSFSLDNLSPWNTSAERRLRLHRFRGGWSMEGQHICEDVEELNLSMPWTYAFPESERFGGIGSHPVKRYFPTCAVEDPDAGVYWGAALSVAGSWQMELSRDCDCFSLSGGLGDGEFAGWCKTVAPGEAFSAPAAYLSVGEDLDTVCRDLYEHLEQRTALQPASEETLPVIFNEWCTTWGNPSHERMLSLADTLAGTNVKYLVIDAGWTNVIPNSFGQGGNGDWDYCKERFPGGLLATSRALRDKGFLLGVWFEFEVTTKGARVYEKEFDHLHLTRGGEVINTGGDRSFWDFRKPEVIAYLREKVIDFLRENEISYMKVDYNGSIGAGCDGGDSFADGLEQQMQAVLAFFDLLRSELPDLVIESCASGGHRLAHPFLERCAMASFSDAHEGHEIPVLAARIHRLIPPRQSQIWSVLNGFQPMQEIGYRLASGFLGRLCLSGGIDGLNEAQMALVRSALCLYEKAATILKTGETTVLGEGSRYLRALTGWQVTLRQSGGKLLAVIHTFEGAPERFCAELPEGDWRVADIVSDTLAVSVEDGQIKVEKTAPFCGAAVLLEQKGDTKHE